MRPEDLNKWLRASPFRPFRLYLTNGHTYDVRHPELVMVGRSAIIVGTPSLEHADPVYDDYTTVALLHINDIKPLPAPAPSGGNGATAGS
jgi:hypothetical protein